MMKLASAIVAIALCLVAPSARADDDQAKAKALYKSGVAHYDKGEYKAAVRDLRAADELVHSPALAFNIAQAYRLLNDCKDALAWYRLYLDRDPLAPNKDKVNEHIGNMLKCLPKKEEAPLPAIAAPATEPAPEAKPEPVAPAPIPTTTAEPPPKVATTEPPPRRPEPTPPPVVTPPPVAPPPEAPPVEQPAATSAVLPPPAEPADVDSGHGKRVTGLVVAGAGVVVATVGVVFALQAKSAADDVSAFSKTGGVWTSSLADKESTGQRDQTIGALGIGVGVAAIVGGGILYYLGATDHAERPPVAVGVGAHGANVVMSWSY